MARPEDSSPGPGKADDALAPTRDLAGETPTGTWNGASTVKSKDGGKPCGDELDLRSGQEIQERYRIISRIGKGGMGSVYRAEDLRLHQELALKFVHNCGQEDHAVQALLNEVRTARKVSHPNVCRVHDLGEYRGMPFVSMEYVDGEDLASLIRRIGRPATEKCNQLARQMCAGLHAAHQQGVLHRDLKPDNLMIDGRGDVRITDFGIAVPTEGDGHHRIAGTPAYMAPELFTGGHAKISTDVYSLGVVLYELYTGRSLNGDRTITELFRGLERSILPPSLLVPGLDRDVEKLILRCLDRDPDLRPRTALEVLAELPGGDALAESLAGGDTPSPELVAASGGSGLLSPGTAMLLAGGVLGAVLLMVLMSDGLKLLSSVRLPKNPEVLRHIAEEHLESFGIPTRMSDGRVRSVSGFQLQEAFLTEKVDGEVVERHQTMQEWASCYQQDRRGMIDFWYRQNIDGKPLLADGIKGRVTYDDPPQIMRGMVNLRMDPLGRLRELQLVPAETLSDMEFIGPDSDGPPGMTWGALMKAAGLELERMEPVESRRIPPRYADERMAWRGAYPEAPDQRIRVEAAALYGVPVMFQIIDQKDPDMVRMPGERRSGASWRYAALVLLIGAAVAMALYSIRHRRGDLQGAVRFGLGMFVAVVGFTVLGGNHGGSWGGIGTLAQKGLIHGIGIGMMLGLFYFAFEPQLRRTWPQAMISWTRLLQARFRDPLVGKHVLVGLWVGVLLSVMHLLRWYVPMWFDGQVPAPSLGHPSALEAYTGVAGSLGLALETGVDVTRVGARVIVTLAVMRILLRNAWAAAVGTVLIWTVVDASPAIDPGLSWLERYAPLLVWFAHNVVMVALILKVGILACLIAGIVLVVFLTFPLQPDLDAWWVSATVVPYGLVLLLLAYSVITATGRAPRVSLHAGTYQGASSSQPI